MASGPLILRRHDEQLAFAAARAICRRHAKSYYFASAFLPRPKRAAAYAVYGFCRMIDDAIDSPDQSGSAAPAPSVCGPSTNIELKLAQFRGWLDQIYERKLELPPPELRDESQHALHAFSLTVHEYEVPKQHFLDLAEGCRMDLTVSRYATWAALERYCYHVAGVVGLVMSRIFGLAEASAQAQAVQMGNAMQLTNILRDVKEDWQRGRIYLPLEDLARFGYSQSELAGELVNEPFRQLMRFEVNRARDLYRQGAEGLRHLANDGSRLTASAMAVIYSGILGAIERQGYDVFTRRAHLTTSQKLRRVVPAWTLARRQAGRPVPNVF